MDKIFLIWLSKYLQTTETEAQKLLDNELARYFLIVWSIYEAKCFDGYVKFNKLKGFVDRIEKSIEPESINNTTKYFHCRYQDKQNYRHLIHGKDWDCPNFDKIIGKDYENLTINEKIYMLAFVTYRYRNNIFHGSKKIASWLKFDEQIKKCIEILQIFIDASLKAA